MFKAALWHRLASDPVGFQGCDTWGAMSLILGGGYVIFYYEARVTQHVDVTSGSLTFPPP